MEEWLAWLVPSKLVLTGITIPVALYYYYTWNYGVLERLGVPVPKPYYPVLGHILLFLRQGLYRTVKKLVDDHGKFVGIYVGREPLIYITDVDILRRILVKDFHLFQDRMKMPARGIFKKTLFDARGEHWRMLRHTMTPTFTSAKLNRMRCLIDACSDRFVENLSEICESGEDFEAKKYCGGFSLDVIASVAFGLDINSQKNTDNKFVLYSKKLLDVPLDHPLLLMSMIFPFLNPVFEYLDLTYFPKDSIAFFTDVVKDTLKDRRQGYGNRVDFLQLLMDAKKLEEEADEEALDDIKSISTGGRKSQAKELTEEDILAQSLLFFAAGYDTTANTMSFLLYNLALNPEAQDTLIQEIDEVMRDKIFPTREDLARLPYLEMCINETLRLYSPLVSVERMPIQDFEYKGVKIPKGVNVGIPIRVLHHDPEVWPDPDKFDPERFTPEARACRDPMYFLPFGMGPRQCIGMRLALLEIKMAIVKLLLKYKIVRSDKTQYPITLKKVIMTTAEGGIMLKLTKRTLN